MRIKTGLHLVLLEAVALLSLQMLSVADLIKKSWRYADGNGVWKEGIIKLTCSTHQ